MSVQNIECQIAQAQISRLLKNEPLGQAIMAELEAHVAACPDCQAFIIEHNRSLDVVVGSEQPAKTKKTSRKSRKPEPEVEEAIQANDEERLAFEKLFRPKAHKAAVETKRETTTVSSFWKPLAYSGALAAVLLAMSYVMKNPTAIFGERVIAPVSAEAKATDNDLPSNASNDRAVEPTPPSAAQTNPSEGPVGTEEPTPTIMNVALTQDAEPIAREDDPSPADAQVGSYVKAPAKPVVSSEPQAPKPAVTPRPRVTVRTLNRSQHRRTVRHRATKPSGSVQFYDANGRPL